MVLTIMYNHVQSAKKQYIVTTNYQLKSKKPTGRKFFHQPICVFIILKTILHLMKEKKTARGLSIWRKVHCLL